MAISLVKRSTVGRPITATENDANLTAVEGSLAPSIKALGAKGDGTTDDTTAFSAAVAAGGVFFVPSGTYRLATWTTRSVSAPLVLVGEDRGTAIIKGPGGSTVNFLAPTADLVLRNLTVRDFNRGVDFSAATSMRKARFLDVAFLNLAASAIYENGTANYSYGFDLLEVAGCLFDTVGNVAIWCYQALQDASVHHNVFRNIVPRAVLLGRSSYAGQEFWKRLNVSDNTFRDITSSSTTGAGAIQTYGRQVTIADNIIENLHGIVPTLEHTGIYTKSRECVISGNTIRNCWVDGVGSYSDARAITVKGVDDDEGIGSQQPEGYGPRVVNNIIEQQEQGLGQGKGIRIYTPRVLCQGNRLYQLKFGIESNSNTARNNVIIDNNQVEGYLTDGVDTPTAGSFGVWANIPDRQFACRNNQITDVETGIRLVGAPGLSIESVKLSGNQIRLPANGVNCLYLTTSSPVEDCEVVDNVLRGGSGYYGVVDVTAPGVWSGLLLRGNKTAGSTGVQGFNITSDGVPKRLRMVAEGLVATTTDGTTNVQVTQVRIAPNSLVRVRIVALGVDASLAHRSVLDLEGYRYFDGTNAPTTIGTDRTISSLQTDVSALPGFSLDSSGRVFWRVKGTAGVTMTWNVRCELETVAA